MNNCVICGKDMPHTRSNAECCSSNCRNKKSRQRARQMKMMRPFTWQLEQYKDLQAIHAISPMSARLIDEIRLLAGVEVAQKAIDAIREIAVVAELGTVSDVRRA